MEPDSNPLFRIGMYIFNIYVVATRKKELQTVLTWIYNHETEVKKPIFLLSLSIMLLEIK